MTPEQATSLREKGYVYLPRAVGKAVVQPVQAHVVSELKRLEIWSTGRSLSKRFRDVPVFQQVGKLGQLINYPGLRERLVSKDLHKLMCDLVAAPVASVLDAQLLISLPHQLAWSLEGLNWHRDVSQSQLAHIPGVQAFILLDELQPQGGATLALPGSHRLKIQMPRKKQGSRFTVTGNNIAVDGVELPVLEMAGNSGDVYLMDMRLLHTPSINATKHVRMMATVRYFRS